MVIKIGRQYIKEQLAFEYESAKALPSLFKNEQTSLGKFVIWAIFLHLVLVGIFYACIEILGIKFLTLNPPEWKDKDIEFVLTQNEVEPINKNTKYRSNENSRAGGIHDPNRKVSMPSPPAQTPNKTKTPTVQPANKMKQQAQKQPAVVQKQPAQKQQVQKAQEVQKGISRPTKPSAPTQRPVLKPSASTPRPQMPKLTNAPSSPFKIAVPNTGAPVGKGFSTSGGTSASGGGSKGSASGSGSKGMPAPQFSTTRTASSNGSSYGAKSGAGSRGSNGVGNMGNPSPGNRNGAPGIDAIKTPQWGPYMRALESKIKQNWHPPKAEQSKRVVLYFKIGRRGELLSIKVTKSSGSQANDQAAIRAVQMSAPFRPLPPEHKDSSIDIDFTFDYNVLGASQR